MHSMYKLHPSPPSPFTNPHIALRVQTQPTAGWPVGLRWAQPSVPHLKQLMRHVVTHPQEAAAKGAAARRRMVERYSPDVIARLLLRELRRIEAALAARAGA